MESLGITHEQAQKLLDEYIKNPITNMHCLESEAIMRELAKHVGENEEQWGVIGLLHDIDWEITKTDTKNHCILCVDILKKAGATDYLIQTIQSHGYGHIEALQGKVRTQRVQFALVAAETVTGLIIASTLMLPDKKLASLKPESLKKKFKTKKFAANCSRQRILECEKIGIPIDEFLHISLVALQNIHEQLGM